MVIETESKRPLDLTEVTEKFGRKVANLLNLGDELTLKGNEENSKNDDRTPPTISKV